MDRLPDGCQFAFTFGPNYKRKRKKKLAAPVKETLLKAAVAAVIKPVLPPVLTSQKKLSLILFNNFTVRGGW